MLHPEQAVPRPPQPSRRACLAALLSGTAALLSACAGGPSVGELSSPVPPPAPPGPDAPPPPAASIGTGQVKVAMILPMSASGNISAAATAMRNAGELALTEFQGPNVQLLIKDDRGSAQGAQQAAQEALQEGAEIIIGPLFAQSVSAVGQVARARGVPVIAFSTDSNVASRGVYLLSFLPENDVDRIVEYQVRQGKRSLAALVPDNAYGSVVEGAVKQTAARRGARIVALERYPQDATQLAAAARTVAQAAASADAIFIPDDAEALPRVVQALNAAGVQRSQLLGTGVWEDARTFNDHALQGGLYAGPDPAGFRGFAGRYRARYGQDPIRNATLAYDAVALVAALVKTQGPDRFSEQVLTNPSGFAGIDGLFRFRADGTNQRGLAVLRVAAGGGQVVSPSPKSFGTGA
jgi:branched-chain amino acid transport system substrate-binding protein